jgi:hypothetical protein
MAAAHQSVDVPSETAPLIKGRRSSQQQRRANAVKLAMLLLAFLFGLCVTLVEVRGKPSPSAGHLHPATGMMLKIAAPRQSLI